MLELVVRLVLGGAVVVAALLAWRHATRAGMTTRGAPALKVVGRAGLTRNALVAVVDVDGRRFLVGAADRGVDLLATLGDAPETSEDTAAAATPTTAGSPQHAAAALGAALGAHGRGTAPATTPGPRIGPLDRLREMTVRTHQREPIRVPSTEPE